MAEVGMGRAGRDNQVVVRYFPVTQDHFVRGRVDRCGLAEKHFDVRLAPQDAPNRARDVARIQCRGRDLVKQGLEQVMVSAIDQRDPDRGVAERPRRRQTAETSAHDHDAWKAA